MFVGVSIFLVLSLASIQSSLSNKKRDINTIEPELILTPYIEEGKMDEAKCISEVNSNIFLGVKSYSGFLTVNKTYNSNLFFWYFPIEDLSVSTNPWIIWLEGSPGSSSMDGLFEEIGPFLVSKKTHLKRNKYSWLKDHSLVFIDNPVGSGFSFTDNVDGMAKDMETYSVHLKLAALQLLQLFPELKEAPLFVAGEYYGGKYAPALAMELHKAKETGLEVNLKGVITGNGYVDASMFLKEKNVYYHKGFLTMEDVEDMANQTNELSYQIIKNESVAAYDVYEELYKATTVRIMSLNPYNIDKNLKVNYNQYTDFLNQNEVRRAIHVGEIAFSSMNTSVVQSLKGDFLTSARPLYEGLLEYYKVLAYCGLSDMMLPCYWESEEYRKWSWSLAFYFSIATRNVYYFNNTKSGYYKSGGHLTEVQIRNAGHFAAMDTPALLQHLITGFTHNYEPASLTPILYKSPNFFSNATIVGL